MHRSMMSYGSNHFMGKSAGKDNRDVGETEMCAQGQRRPRSRREARTRARGVSSAHPHEAKFCRSLEPAKHAQ